MSTQRITDLRLYGTRDASRRKAIADSEARIAELRAKLTEIRAGLDARQARPTTTPSTEPAERLCTARLSTGPDAWLLCILHEGHLADHRSGDVTWMGAW